MNPRKDKRGVDLIFDVLPFGRFWYAEPDAISNAIGYAKFTAVHARLWFAFYDEAGTSREARAAGRG